MLAFKMFFIHFKKPTLKNKQLKKVLERLKIVEKIQERLVTLCLFERYGLREDNKRGLNS